MAQRIEAVIFDHSTLLVPQSRADVIGGLDHLLERLKHRGLRIVVFSNDPQDISEALATRNLPQPDLFLTSWDTGKSKGSPLWVQVAASRLGLEPHQFLYVGDDRRDWRTAINAATFYVHAAWVKPLEPGETAVTVENPGSVFNFASHFLMLPPRWAYALDRADDGLTVRCLLPASVELASSVPGSRFTLQDVFTYENQIRVGTHSARDVLMLHALSSLYLEGLIPPRSYFAVYPSSTMGKLSQPIQAFLEPASRLFHGYFKLDLLERASPGKDTSMERVKARREGRNPNVSFADQTSTVRLNPSFAGKLAGRTVIVVDDFTTTGLSLEWARLLLFAGGARDVVLMTIGKYPKPHTLVRLKPGKALAPFELGNYSTDEFFSRIELSMLRNAPTIQLVQSSFENLRDGNPYPL